MCNLRLVGLNLGIEKFLNSYRIIYVRWGDDMKVEASVFSQMIMQGSKVVTEELYIRRHFAME